MIDGNVIYDYIISGATNIIRNEQNLNQINVFPVADGDTGSNLAFTMKSILARAERHSSASETLKSISQVAIEDSFGNSGSIMAGYLYGLATESKDRDKLSYEEFVLVSVNSVDYAYKSISKPVEGTILTVMREWAEYLNKNIHLITSFKILFKQSLDYVSKVLENTKNQIKVLEEYNFVDAGAKGFVYFLEGIFSSIENLNEGFFSQRQESVIVSKMIHEDIKETKFQYCTEFLVESSEDISEFLANYSNYGDSLGLNHIGNYYKLHIHTNTPASVYDAISKRANIIKAKVDDMNMQQLIVNQPKATIGLFTDSIADVNEDLKKRYLIQTLPMHFVLDGTDRLDRLLINNENVFTVLDDAKEFPKSAQPSDSDIRRLLNQLTNHFEYVLGIIVSDKMSGTYEKINRIIQQEGYSNIRVIDSRTNSAAQGLLLYDAVKMIEEKQKFEAIVAHLEADRSKYKILVEIKDLSYATQSGRVPKIIGKLTKWLKVPIVISIDESGNGIVKKRFNLLKMIKQTFKNHKTATYGLVYTGDFDKVAKRIEEIQGYLGKKPLFVEPTSAVVAAFVGKNAIGIGYKEE